MFKRIFIGLALSIFWLGSVLPTVTDTYTPVQVSADGSETDFDFGFKVFNQTDIEVFLVDETTLAETEQTLSTDYTVVLNTSTAGGTVTFLSPPANTYYVAIRRAMPLTQSTDIPTQGLFREQQIENALDKLTMVSQDLDEKVGRAILQNPFSTTLDIIIPAPESDKLIGWNTAGTGLENKVAIDADTATACATAQAAAEVAQAAAEASAASINLPALTSGDVDKVLQVNATYDGYDLTAGNAADKPSICDAAGFPITPSSAPTTDYQVANKKYVDDSNGRIIQVVNTLVQTRVTGGSTTTPADNTIPQNTEGNEFITCTITPTSATSKLLIRFTGNFRAASNVIITTALFQDDTADALAACPSNGNSDAFPDNIVLEHWMVAGTTSATTFKIRVGGTSGAVEANGTGSAQLYNGKGCLSLTITEIKS